MRQATVQVANRLGIHARSSFMLSALAKEFSASIWLKNERGVVSLSKPLEILRLQLRYLDEVIVIADGIDEAEALSAICEKLVEI